MKTQVTRSIKVYIDALDQAVKADREANGKKPLKARPDSGYMVRDGNPEGFFYLDHRTIDHKYNIMTDVHMTPGNVHDSVLYIDRLENIVSKFGFEQTLEAVALDAGYVTS